MTDFNAFAQRLGLEEDEYLELLELFVNTSGADLDRIESSIATNDPESAAKAAHSLKGSSSSLGLEDISEAARKIEKSAKENSLKRMAESVGAIKEKIMAIAVSIAE